MNFFLDTIQTYSSIYCRLSDAEKEGKIGQWCLERIQYFRKLLAQ